MSDKFVTFDEGRSTPTGLPQAVDAKINTRYATKAELNSAIIGTGGVVSPSVSRIIASTNPDTPLNDGDLLLVYAPPVSMVEDFTEGMAAWSPMGHPHSWAHEVIDGDGMVTVTPAEDAGRGFLTSDTVGEVDDVEVVVKMTSTVVSAFMGTGVGIRLSGAPGSENGYVVYPLKPDGGGPLEMTMARYNDGVLIPIGARQIPFEVDASSFFWVRVRNESGRLYVKFWADGDDEPAEWQADVSGHHVSTPGRVGLVPGSRPRKNFYTYFSAAEIDSGDETAQVVTS